MLSWPSDFLNFVAQCSYLSHGILLLLFHACKDLLREPIQKLLQYFGGEIVESMISFVDFRITYNEFIVFIVGGISEAMKIN